MAPIHDACKKGEVEAVQELLEQGVDVNWKCNEGQKYTPLQYACRKGDTEVVKLLLQWKADENAKDDKSSTPLHKACANGHYDVVRLLLEEKAHVDSKTKNGRTSLHDACRNGHTEVAELLLQWNADLNAKYKNGWTPLHTACRNGQTEVASLLLEWEADVNVKNNSGRTPLHPVCQNGHTEVVRLLLQRKADVNARSKDNVTPLQGACQEGHVEVAKLLLQWNADVNSQDNGGLTSLHRACYYERKDTAQLLLDWKANVSLKNHRGLTALDYCRSADMRRWLRQAIRTRETEQLEVLDRFAPSIRDARSNTAALAQQAAGAALGPVDEQTLEQFIANADGCYRSFWQFIADAHGCYQHTKDVRQARNVVIELVMRCCTVCRAMESHTTADTDVPDDVLLAAEAALEQLHTLQQQIRDDAGVQENTLAERDDMRQECVRLIDSALTHQPTDMNTDTDTERKAQEVLKELRVRPPIPLDDTREALSLRDLQRLCEVARDEGEQFATELGHNSAAIAASDVAVADLGGMLPSVFTSDDRTSASAKRKCMCECVTSLAQVMALQKDSNEKLTEPVILVDILCKLENALDGVCSHFEQVRLVNTRFAQLRQQQIQLKEGLARPDLKIVERHLSDSVETTRNRELKRAEIIIARNKALRGATEERLALERSERDLEDWERDIRRDEKVANRKLVRWLQIVHRQYPELLLHPSVLQCFSVDELECARLGLLRKGDTEINYTQVALLSVRPGRPVQHCTDPNGDDVVLKSYNLTSEVHCSHFLRTCAKLGALRGVLNIAPVLGVFTEKEWGRVIMPYYANGDLAAWISARPQRDAALCLRMAHQIVTAVNGLHTLDIVHCDLKPKNVFITATHQAVLGDFDDVRDADSTLTSAAGTTRDFAAPEILSGSVKLFEKSADVYSLGLILQTLLHGVSITGIYRIVTDEAIASIVQQMTDTNPSRRPTLAYILAQPLFSELNSERVCGACLDTYAAASSLTCTNGHVVCNVCLDRALGVDLNGEQHVANHNGLLPCMMRANGCDSVWEPKTYASHVTRGTFDQAMQVVSLPAVRKQVLVELQREAAEDREFNHIANEILPLRCPKRGHVLDESFDACFALTCSSCPHRDNEFCALCWGSFGKETHSHVMHCARNPRPGEVFNAIEVFYDIRREDRSRQLREYWATLDLDNESKAHLALRVQPLLDQLKPEGTYDTVAAIVE